MLEERSQYVEKVNKLILELSHELFRLTPVLKKWVAEVKGNGGRLDPTMEACLMAASALKEMIRYLEEELSDLRYGDA